MPDWLKTLTLALVASSALSGCALVAAGTAGGVAATELEEDDGEFDPLENTEAAEQVDEAL